MGEETFRAANGVQVRMDNRYAQNGTPQAYARLREAFQRAVDEICREAAARTAAEGGKEQKRKEQERAD